MSRLHLEKNGAKGLSFGPFSKSLNDQLGSMFSIQQAVKSFDEAWSISAFEEEILFEAPDSCHT